MKVEIDLIKARAFDLGFSFIGFTDAEQTPHFDQYEKWLQKDLYGSLDFLNKEYVVNARRNPASTLKGARSVIVLGVNYGAPSTNNRNIPDQNGIISRFALYEDYHRIIRSKAEELIGELSTDLSTDIRYKIFIDSGPLMEKDFAFKAGLGWIGKHSLFIHPSLGSYVFLCCIMLNVPINTNFLPAEDLCGDCQACIHACPTGCIDKNDHSINITQCISYLTIEHNGIIPREMRLKIGNHIYGCDVCQEVCPLNGTIQLSRTQHFFGLDKIIPREIGISHALQISQHEFRTNFKGSVISSISFEKYLSNIIIAAGNSQKTSFINPLKGLLGHPLATIRVHAIWALNQIDTAYCQSILGSLLKGENNADVLDEISHIRDSENS